MTSPVSFRRGENEESPTPYTAAASAFGCLGPGGAASFIDPLEGALVEFTYKEVKTFVLQETAA